MCTCNPTRLVLCSPWVVFWTVKMRKYWAASTGHPVGEMRSTRQGGSPLSSSPCPLYRELLEYRTWYTHVVELANSSDRVPGTHGNIGQSSSMEDVNRNLELVIVTETFLWLQMKPRNASTVKDWTTMTTKTTGNVLTIHWTIILTKEDPQVFLGDHLKMEAICHPLAPPTLK